MGCDGSTKRRLRRERVDRKTLGKFVNDLVREGRYGSQSEIVREGLRLVEEREAKLKALRETIDASIAQGGSHSADEVDAYIDERLDQWEAAQAQGK
jgi:antitoxin ParD1/3/4